VPEVSGRSAWELGAGAVPSLVGVSLSRAKMSRF